LIASDDEGLQGFDLVRLHIEAFAHFESKKASRGAVWLEETRCAAQECPARREVQPGCADDAEAGAA
jgi:uncharacterized protein (UPF0179 family)